MIKKIHFIWMGSVLPSTDERPYANRILRWAQTNKDWQVQLWVVSAFLDPVAKQQHDHLIGQRNNLGIRVLEDEISMVNKLGMADELVSEIRFGGADKKLNNWGAASDILRVCVLLSEGGLYLDTDVDPGEALGDLQAPQDFLVHVLKIGPSASFTNDAMYAATTGHPFFAEYRDLIKQNYQKHWLQASSSKPGQAPKPITEENAFDARRTDKSQKLQTTVAMSGPGALEEALSRYLGCTLFELEERGKQLALPDRHIRSLAGSFASDASWL